MEAIAALFTIGIVLAFVPVMGEMARDIVKLKREWAWL
jgi:hypothetical protein